MSPSKSRNKTALAPGLLLRIGGAARNSSSLGSGSSRSGTGPREQATAHVLQSAPYILRRTIGQGLQLPRYTLCRQLN
jgi:hypothetical protein